MSKAEYKSLLYRVSKRLDEINALDHIFFIYEERLGRQTGQDIHNTLSLLRKLEERSFLGVDYLQELKDVLRDVEEWDLHEKVVKFQSKRRKYKEFLRWVIRKLEELNNFERLMDSVYRVRRIPEESKNDVHDVRSLIQILEDISFLGIDCLREIFIELNNNELLTELAEFQKRQIEDETREWRKAKVVAVCSSVRTASQRMIGEVKVQCTFRTLSGVVLVVGTGLILRRCSTLEDFVEAFRVATLPAANALRAISEGSLCFTVQAETSLALEELFERYSTGRLQKDLQEFLVTDDIRQLADGEEVILSVYIDEKEFREALDDLTNVDQEGRDDIEEKQARYLNEEKMAFVENYLENTEDTRSLTTGTSDDGIGSHSTPSDLALEEPRVPCLKDLRGETIEELTRRLRLDKVSCNQFYHSFGLENRHPEYVSLEIGNIGQLFPDTPIKLVTDVFRSLHLYDLAELLEKAIQPRTLRPALPLKEIATLLNYRNRPTTFYSKVNIVFVGDGEKTFDIIGNFFKKICPGSKISRTKPEFDLSYGQLQRNFELATEREIILLRMERYEEKGRRLFGRRRDGRTELEKRKDKIDKELLQMNGEFKEEKKKVEADISSAFDKSWGKERDNKSTLFVTFRVPNSKRDTTMNTEAFPWRLFTDCSDPITAIIMEKLTSFPSAPKLVVTPTWKTHPSKEVEEIPESLHVEYAGSEGVVRSILEVLSKRLQTLDLISVMKEVQRSTSKYSRINNITDNLSAIPRFQPTPEQS